MGHSRHHIIVVSTYRQDYISKAYEAALFNDNLVTLPMFSPVNGIYTLVVLPDGSGEGWTPSVIGDGRRERFIKWLDKQRHEDGSCPYAWAEVQYGDDEGDDKITKGSYEYEIGDDYVRET